VSAELQRTQELLSQLIRATDGVERTLAADAAQARELRGALARTVRSDDRLDAVHRLEVYANAYFYRILDCLKEDFPALLAAIGETAFHDLITAYLRVHPSDSYSMRHVGRHVAGFLESGRSVARLRERFPWAASLARFEWSFLDAFDAPNVPVATREDFAHVQPEAFVELRFELDPSVQRLELDARAVRIHSAHQAGETLEPGSFTDAPVHVLVWRRGERVSSRHLSSDEALALDGLARGLSFGETCVEIAERVGEETAPAALAGWLGGWLAAGCLSRPRAEAPAA